MEMERTSREIASMRTVRDAKMKNRRSSRNTFCIAVVLILQLFPLGIARAQQISESLYSEMKWRMIGPFRGGKGNAVAGGPRKPRGYFFLSGGGGGWGATRGGRVRKATFHGEAVASPRKP